MLPRTRVFVKRLTAAAVCAACVHTLVARRSAEVSDWIARAGNRAGCEWVFMSGVYAVTDSGVFHGDDPKTRAWNVAYRHGASLAAAGAAWGAGAGVYLLAAGPLGRTRVFGHRGATRCGRCGYDLAGLAQPRCPECGRVL